MDLSKRWMDHLDFDECIGTLLKIIASPGLILLLSKEALLGFTSQRKALCFSV